MNVLFGFANSLSREYAQQHLVADGHDHQVITVGTLAEAIKVANETPSIDVVALDLAMPDMNRLRGVKQFQRDSKLDKPLGVMGFQPSGKEIRDLLLAGVSGYLPYSMNAKALMSALELLAAGETYVPTEFLADNTARYTQSLLTSREQEVLAGLLSGRSNKEIAGHLNLSEVTIKHHLKGLRSKLGARNRTHAVCRAIELGIG